MAPGILRGHRPGHGLHDKKETIGAAMSSFWDRCQRKLVGHDSLEVLEIDKPTSKSFRAPVGLTVPTTAPPKSGSKSLGPLNYDPDDYLMKGKYSARDGFTERSDPPLSTGSSSRKRSGRASGRTKVTFGDEPTAVKPVELPEATLPPPPPVPLAPEERPSESKATTTPSGPPPPSTNPSLPGAAPTPTPKPFPAVVSHPPENDGKAPGAPKSALRRSSHGPTTTVGTPSAREAPAPAAGTAQDAAPPVTVAEVRSKLDALRARGTASAPEYRRKYSAEEVQAMLNKTTKSTAPTSA
jgi:hypothetical protein